MANDARRMGFHAPCAVRRASLVHNVKKADL